MAKSCNGGDGVNVDDGQMVVSCLEEGGPLGVKTTGSPNIGFANPSNLFIHHDNDFDEVGDSHVIENGNGDDKLPEKRQICRSSYIQQRPP